VTRLDERIAAGMREQLALRRERLRDGERPLGWKVGFGAPAAATQLGIDRPLVGFLTGRGLLPEDATVDVGAWAKPMLEPEIAVHLARDLGPGASRDDVVVATRGLSAAIELADLDPPPADVRAILAGNIYHRHFVLGPVDEARKGAEGIGARVLRDGEEVASTDDPEALTGELFEVVRLTGELLEACGERLRAGDVVITGSVVAPVPVAPGQRLAVELGPLGRLAVSFESDPGDTQRRP
jgi:2-keto-4-pentenoate hydratase